MLEILFGALVPTTLLVISLFMTLKDIEENGFHWFKSPMLVTWNLIWMISLITRVAIEIAAASKSQD